MIISKCHSARIEKALKDFYAHAKETGPYTDTTAVPEDGDDTHYYELDARIVDTLLDVMEKAGYAKADNEEQK